jgi:AAA domain-containing protein
VSNDDLIPANAWPEGWSPFGGGSTDPEEQKEYARLWAARNGNARYERVAKSVVAEKAPARQVERSSAVVMTTAEQQGELLTLPTLEDFIAVEEPGAGALVGTADAALIPEDGDIMFYGDGGAGKTTLAIDLACHLAAGDSWLALPVAKQSNVLLIENEGARPLFRAKLRRKSEAWTGSPLRGRIRVFEHPWAWFTFADGAKREALAAKLGELEIDVLVVGPVTRSGMDQAGTLQDVRDFTVLVGELRRLSGRRLTVVLIHHENKGGQVSGAWEGAGDTLLHVQGQGHGRTRLVVQKARWSSAHHATSLPLVWTEGEGFDVEEKDELDDETLAEQILTVIGENPGTGWAKVEEATPGVNRQRRRDVRDGLFVACRIVNVRRKKGETDRGLDHVEEATPARLYLADDPTISHLRPESGADGAQLENPAPDRGAGDPKLHLRPAPRPIGAQGVGAAGSHPSKAG